MLTQVQRLPHKHVMHSMTSDDIPKSISESKIPAHGHSMCSITSKRSQASKRNPREKKKMSSILIFDEIASRFEIGGNHLFDQVIEGNFAFPSKNFLGFSRITEQEASRGKRELIWIHQLNRRTRLRLDGNILDQF